MWVSQQNIEKENPKRHELIFYNVTAVAQLLHGMKRASSETGICAEYMSGNEVSKNN
jgi:hypothetical protein